MQSPTLVFDVNETLLDLGGLDAPFEALFGSSDARTDWFKQLLQLSLLSNTLEDYADFSVLGRRALFMVAAQRDRTLPDNAPTILTRAIQTLAPHPEVATALQHLRNAGYRIAALTNSNLETVRAQCSNAGITELFDVLLSIDSVRRYKPARETYDFAARELSIPITEMMLVAAHGWDVLGAMRAGARAAFIARPKQVLIPEMQAPEIVVRDLTEFADKLAAHTS